MRGYRWKSLGIIASIRGRREGVITRMSWRGWRDHRPPDVPSNELSRTSRCTVERSGMASRSLRSGLLFGFARMPSRAMHAEPHSLRPVWTSTQVKPLIMANRCGRSETYNQVSLSARRLRCSLSGSRGITARARHTRSEVETVATTSTTRVSIRPPPRGRDLRGAAGRPMPAQTGGAEASPELPA